ncbi:hypothetical protein [Rossellomorea sp. KS-H15a]|uniref:hypothetical protein n=1 Tax=Rossellomorea sp. KS-H15a TaxID=2963940 RepID=UPI0020C71E53|nr:hypothetical protein [Rossellomorea sp. KS-H15a]UTE77429.1 hypothetical protein M1J35_01010 [Rossellomorea sp. KS-H15a]
MAGNKEGFIDHGIPVQAEEERTSAFCLRGEECRFVIAGRGFLIILNPHTGNHRQMMFPDGFRDYPFSSYSSDGLFYTGAGNRFIVLDPFLEEFVHWRYIENGEEIVGFSFAEDRDGLIYFTTYPRCHLLRYNPVKKEITDFGSMEETEKYPGTLALDQEGWAYVGIGTERKNIVAFHLEDRRRKSLVPQSERVKGVGYVYNGMDGAVYGHWEADDFLKAVDSSYWMKFSGGDIKETTNLSLSRYAGKGFHKVHRNGESPFQVRDYSLSEGYAQFFHSRTGIDKRIEFNYETEGANLSTIVLGPDERLYGTSMHPLQLYRYCFKDDAIQNFGGEVVEGGGGGNIAAYACLGNVMYGAAYAGGKLYRIDTSKPFALKENPKLLLKTEAIHRPRCALALRNGVHIIWGGFPGYGMIGGGLGIYNTMSGKFTLLAHHRIVPNQSTLCLGELSNGLIIGGTSIETPGGAQSNEDEAYLYLMDWEREVVKDRFVPIKGAKEIAQLYVDQFDRVHCLTDSSIYFVINPVTKKMLIREDLSRWGSIVREGFIFDQESHSLIILLSKALLCVKVLKEVDAHSKPEVLSFLPKEASSGIVLHKRRIYYGSGSHLCSVCVD